MAAFKPSYIAARALQFIELASACDEEGESLTLWLYFRKKERLVSASVMCINKVCSTCKVAYPVTFVLIKHLIFQ